MEPEDQRVVGTAEDPPQVRGDLLIERDVLPRNRKRKRHAGRRSIEPDKNPRHFRTSSVAVGGRIQIPGPYLEMSNSVSGSRLLRLIELHRFSVGPWAPQRLPLLIQTQRQAQLLT
jgi:hypothetical protein